MSISELDFAIRAGSALSDLTDASERDDIRVAMGMWDGRVNIRLSDDRGWEYLTDGDDVTKVMGKAFKAITARRLHIANSAPGER